MKTKLNKWKLAFFVCLALLVSSNIFLVFEIIDSGISYTYLKASCDDQTQANEVLGNLIVKGGKQYSQKDILHLLRQAYPNEFIVEEGNKIIMGSNRFEFENGHLVKVQ